MNRLQQLRRRLIANVRVHAVSRFGKIAVGVVLLPYILSHLSRAEYGLWAWLFTLLGYLSLADFGLAQGNIRPFAGALGSGDVRRTGELLGGTLLFHLAIVLLVAVPCVVFWQPLDAALGAPGNLLPVFFLLLVAQGVTILGFPLGALLTAAQRLDLVHKIRIGQIVLQAVGTIVALELGGGLVGLATLHVILGVYQTLLRAWWCRRLVPEVRPVWPRREEFPELARIGLPLVTLSAFTAVIFEFERVILGFLADFEFVAQYAVAQRLVTVTRVLPYVLVFSTIATSAALDAERETRALRNLYVRSFKAIALTIPYLIASIWVCGPWLLRLWLGEGFQQAAALLVPLGIGMLIPAFCTPAINLSIGRGRMSRLSRTLVLWAAVFVVVDGLWLLVVGASGAGWGIMTINGLGTAVFLARYHRLEVNARAEAARFLLGAGISASLAWLIGSEGVALAETLAPGTGRFFALRQAVLGGALVTTTFMGCIWLSGLLSRDDRRVLVEVAVPGSLRRWLTTARS